MKTSSPTGFEIGDPPITLTAEGNPPDGTYEWSATPGLAANGSTAEFTSQEPGDVTIEVTYTPPDGGEPCPGTHTITVLEECSVSITGPSVIGVGNHITLTASGSPEGGTCVWEEPPGLIPGTSSASFTGQTPGDVTIKVVYTPPDGGEPCPATHDVTVFGVESITGPSCVNSGTTLTRKDFSIVTDPTGFENLAIVSPLSFSTLSQSAEVTVTAASGTGAGSDEETTTIAVVNSNVKTTKEFSFEIPNYVSKPLEVIGLADKVDLSVGIDFKDFKECCAVGAAKSTDGKTTVGLNVQAGPFTIIGVPIPPNFKKWVAADLLNITLSGVGSVKLNGNYNACDNNTTWSGGGDLAAGVEAASMVKAEVPKVIILKGKIAGSTSITETFATNLTNLTLTTSWDGLTASGVIIVEIPIAGPPINFKASRTYFAKDNLLSAPIALPSLE